MKTGQAAKITRYLPVGRKARPRLSMARAVARLAMLGVAGVALLSVFPDQLLASIDPEAGGPVRPALKLWTVAQATAPPGDAVVPPVRREALPAEPAATPTAQPAPAATAPAKKPEAQPAAADTKQAAPASPPSEPDSIGVLGTIQDWLARANREYQGVIVKELSLPPGAPPPAEDAIAKKLKDDQAEEARKAADAKRTADDAAKAAAADTAAKAKAAESKKLAEDKLRAEETKRLADEAKKKADELLKADTKPAPKPAAQPELATPSAPADAKPDDAARLADQQRLEAARVAAEVKRQEQQRLADEAKRADDARKKADAARAEAARIADERRKAAATEVKHRSRTIVLTPEPLPAPVVRPVDPGTTFRPELAASSGARRTSSSADASVEPAPQRRRIRIYREATYRGITTASYHPARGTAIKRWVWRAPNGQSCRAAGRRVSPPARYTIRRGDSLWRISERHYHQGRLYPKIYRANRAAIADPDLIYPCQRVMVPR